MQRAGAGIGWSWSTGGRVVVESFRRITQRVALDHAMDAHQRAPLRRAGRKGAWNGARGMACSESAYPCGLQAMWLAERRARSMPSANGVRDGVRVVQPPRCSRRADAWSPAQAHDSPSLAKPDRGSIASPPAQAQAAELSTTVKLARNCSRVRLVVVSLLASLTRSFFSARPSNTNPWNP